ncbi:hypothetical protein [Thalassotalea sp. PLHSN55]|uniref:hypothetical protein n=1 Tax=Thalassotalea sp. PLHSN55 TaxID=3435888 RepID=UPI003F857BFD
MDKISVVQVGGSIERAVKGEYHLDMKAIINEAWRSTQQSRLSLNVGLLFTYFIGIIAALAVGEYFGGLTELINSIELKGDETKMPEDVAQKINLIFMVVAIVQCPLFAALDMMGVMHSVGIKTKTSLIFAFFKRSSWVILCSLLSSILIQLGLQLFVLPGLFLAVSLTIVMPLVIDKKLSAMKAIIVCVQATRFQWFKIAGLYLILAGAFAASMLPLMLLANTGAAIIGVMVSLFLFTYLAPMFFNVKGIIYREMFGVQLQANGSNGSSANDVFIA